jgi:hypothetical protein
MYNKWEKQISNSTFIFSYKLSDRNFCLKSVKPEFPKSVTIHQHNFAKHKADLQLALTKMSRR